MAIRDAFKAMRRQLQDYVRCLRHDVKMHHPSAACESHQVLSEGRLWLYRDAGWPRDLLSQNSVLSGGFEHLDIGDEVIFSEEAGDKNLCASPIRLSGKHHPMEDRTSEH